LPAGVVTSSRTFVVDPVVVNVMVYLEGPFAEGVMRTDLREAGLLPATQPFNAPPWSYAGMEKVGSFPADVVDWVLVEVREDSSTVVRRRAGLLTKNGMVVEMDGTSPLQFAGMPSGEYHIVIRHRNHLAIATANPVSLNGASPVYDFSTGMAQAYGTHAQIPLGNGVYGMIAGDADGSNDVNALDRTATWNDRNLAGYLQSDVDLSGDVSAMDRTITWNNRNSSGQVPDTPAASVRLTATTLKGSQEGPQ
jgi:hypothetical protein